MSKTIDPNSGFCSETSTFHSLRPPLPLPPLYSPLSIVSYVFALLPSPLPAHPALVDATTATSLTYSDLISRLRNLSYALQTKFNLSKGDVAFILSPSCLDLPVLYLSLLSIGVVVSPANPASTPSEISRLVNLVNPSIAFAASSAASRLPGNIHTVVRLDSPEFSALSGRQAIGQATADILQNDAAVIQFSSGTTGSVKAAALSHRNLIAMVANMCTNRCWQQANMVTAPMFHSMGFISVVGGMARGDAMVVMNRPGFSEMLKAMEKYRVNSLTVAPPVVVAMGRSDEVARFDLGAMTEVVCGGAALSVEAAVRFRKRFPGVLLRLGYGSTEGGGLSTMNGAEECCQLRSAGRLSPNVDAKIVNIVNGNTLSVEQRGELWVRGPSVMIGYVGDKDANASTFDPNGWLKTGDICYFDTNGFLYIVDRIKELIKYKGYQVSPAELEQVLLSIPDVLDAAVIPYPHEEAGQIPMAVVVKKPGSNLNESQVINYVAKQVAPYKKIRKAVFINSIPKSPAGKILRRELAAHVLKGPLPRL